jgi:hydrophobe/amphiphile efflux-3 (HAE3) family protein
MAERILRFVLRYPKTVVLTSLLFVLVMGLGIRNLEIDPSIKNMLPQDFPELLRLDEFEETFSASDILLIAVRAEDFLAAESLDRLSRFQVALEEREDVDRVMSVFSVKHLEAAENSFTPRTLVDPEELPVTAEEKAAIRRILEEDDFYAGNIISRDLRTLAFIVLPEMGFNDRVLSTEVKELASSLLGDAAMVTGLPSTRTEVMGGMQGDMKTFMPLGIILMILLLVFSFRSWLGTFLPLVVVILSIISTFGLMGFAGEKIRMVTLIMPVMLIAIANDYGIHLVAHYLGRAGTVEGSRRGHIYHVARSLGVPIMAAGLTTVAGFLTLTTHLVPSVRWAGVLSAFGVVIAFLLSLTFIPAMLVLLKPPSELTQAFADSRLTRALQAFCRFLRRRGRLAAVTLVGVCLVAVLGLPDLNVDTDPVRYFHSSSPVRQANVLVNEVFGGSSQLNVVVKGDIKSPALLRKMEAFQEHLESFSTVSRTQSVADMIKRMNRAFHNDDPAFEVIPDDRNAVAQYLLLYSFNSDLSDFDHFVDFDYTQAQITARVNSTSSSDIQALMADTEAYIGEHLTREEFPTVTGFVTILGKLVDLVVYGQLISLAVSLLLVFAITALLFRSPVGGLVISLPLAFAVLMVFGLMGHFDIELNIATAMLSSILVGVGVDYLIHFLWHYREHLHESGDAWEAVNQTILTSGRGIIVNALSVVVGFSVMLLSNFLPIFFFGFLLTISISSCLLAAMLLLPVIVTWFRPGFLARPAAAPSAGEAALPLPADVEEPGKLRPVLVATRGLGAALAVGIAIVLWWVGDALAGWYQGLPVEQGFWGALWELIRDNPSIVAALYVLACLNASGVAEFKFGRRFTKAFVLSLLLTPPVMIGAWARRGR